MYQSSMISTTLTDILTYYSKCGTTKISDAANTILNAKLEDMNGVYFAGCSGLRYQSHSLVPYHRCQYCITKIICSTGFAVA